MGAVPWVIQCVDDCWMTTFSRIQGQFEHLKLYCVIKKHVCFYLLLAMSTAII